MDALPVSLGEASDGPVSLFSEFRGSSIQAGQVSTPRALPELPALWVISPFGRVLATLPLKSENRLQRLLVSRAGPGGQKLSGVVGTGEEAGFWTVCV